MLNEAEITELVKEYGPRVNEGRSIKQLIADGDIPRLKSCSILEGKVSDSVFGEQLTASDNRPLRLMFRNNRISTHDVNRGAIPFKDQVLAINHAQMLKLVEPVLGSSQFHVPGLLASSTVIPAENLKLIALENVLRFFNAQSSTSTSLYQHWLRAKAAGDRTLVYAGHQIDVAQLDANSVLPYIMDTPSTKDKVDRTIDPAYLVESGVCTPAQYTQIRNSSIMAFGIVSQYLAGRGMVLVDTKTEHGINAAGQIVVADEVYTMDSSRFWRLDDSGRVMTRDGRPVSFSKEFARGMVTEKNQQFTSEQASQIAVRYILGLQHLTGEAFDPDLRPRDQRIIESVNHVLDHLL